MTTPLAARRISTMPCVGTRFQVVSCVAKNHLAIATAGLLYGIEFEMAGATAGLSAIIVSNDHASDRAWIKSRNNAEAGRGICLVAGDSLLIPVSAQSPASDIVYEGTISCALYYQ